MALAGYERLQFAPATQKFHRNHWKMQTFLQSGAELPVVVVSTAGALVVITV